MLLARLCKAIMSASYLRCLGCGKLIDSAKGEPTCNDCPAGWSVHLAYDQLHKAINDVMKDHCLEVKREADGPEFFDPTFGDEKECKCGHAYYRHFYTYDAMRPVGCKYCHMTDECTGFELAEGSK